MTLHNVWDLVGVQCLVPLYRPTWYVERVCKRSIGGATLGLGLVDYASIILGIIVHDSELAWSVIQDFLP